MSWSLSEAPCESWSGIKNRATLFEPALLFIVSVLFTFFVFSRPPVCPTGGVDPSRMYPLLNGFRSGWNFAYDARSTRGPPTFLYMGMFDDNVHPSSLEFHCLQATIVTVSIYFLPTRYLTGGLFPSEPLGCAHSRGKAMQASFSDSIAGLHNQKT